METKQLIKNYSKTCITIQILWGMILIMNLLLGIWGDSFVPWIAVGLSIGMIISAYFERRSNETYCSLLDLTDNLLKYSGDLRDRLIKAEPKKKRRKK